MTQGGVLPVPSNGIHDARPPVAPTVLATLDEVLDGGGNFALTEDDVSRLLPWQHSIWWEPNFLYPFSAVLRAQQMTWGIIRENFDDMLHSFLSEVPKADEAFEPGISPGVYSDAPLHRSGNALTSCISQRSGPKLGRNRQVKFHGHIDLFIGDCQEPTTNPISVPIDLLPAWTEKPWQLRTRKSQPIAEADPPSCEAVLISSKGSIRSNRWTDDFHNIPQRVAQASTETPRNPAVHRPFPPPAFVTDIFGLPGVLALPPDYLREHSVLVRTWYLHHVHYPRWVAPRFVEIDHEWNRWQREIAGAWREMILPRENVHFHTVLPDPDRSYIPRQVVADVIVSQGDEYDDIDRFAGLLTVFQQDINGHRRPFALAVSLPEDVSGIGLAGAADISHICNTATCHFYYGWNRIPYSLVPSHHMLDGHGFVAHITPLARQNAGQTAHSSNSHSRAPQDRGSANSDAAGSHQNNDRDTSRDRRSDSMDFDQQTDTSLPDSPSQFEQWQGVQVYSLGRPVVHCFVRWGTYNVILRELALFLRERLRNLVGIHHVQCALANQHEAEESIILQYTNDLTPGSTEQLIILDVEVHFHAPSVGLLRAPEVTRRVHRVVPQITRAFVLRLARLSNYCFLQGDRCLVFWNSELWAEQDTRVRPVQHGTYLKVVATPPLDDTVPPDVAVNFAISVDEDEATAVADCTMQPRTHRAMALYQVQSTLLKVETNAAGVPSTLMYHQDCESHAYKLDLHLPEHRALPPSQTHAQSEHWLRQLRSLFNLAGFVECTEEGFVAYITTWFVDHAHHPRCERSRSVRITAAEVETWREQIIEAWNDKIDPAVPIDLWLVSPVPPSTETESTMAHILLEQNRIEITHSAGIISVIRQDERHASLRHVAVSVRRPMSAALTLRIARLQDLCMLRRCAVFTRGVPLPEGALEDLESGFCLVVFVPSAQANDFLPLPFNTNHLQLWDPAMAAVMDAHARQHEDPEVGDDDIAFLQRRSQRSATLGQLRRTSPVSCKTGDADDDGRELPISFPGPDLPRRRLPRHDGGEDWIPVLGPLFQTSGTRDVWNDEITMTVTTWFIHHNRRTSCRRPRIVQMHSHPITWVDDLRVAWVDVMDQRRPFAIRIVHPRPPQFRTEPSACHILLEQGQHEQHAAVVLTALFEGPNRDGIIQGAFSVPAQVSASVIINTMDLAFFCANRRCALRHEERTLGDDEWVAARSGLSLSIRVASTPDPSTTEDSQGQQHFEDLSLMQFPRQSVQDHSPELPVTDGLLNPHAHVFQPDQPNLWLHPDYIQDLHEVFAQRSCTWESEEASIQIMVWFVDHRFHMSACRFPRPATLFADFSDWEYRIKQAWSDSLLNDLPTEIVVVSPTPPRLEPEAATHVIVMQAPNDALATSLVSVFDSEVGSQPHRIAITTPERVTFEQVLQAVGYEAICSPAQQNVDCTLWFDQQRITPGHPILGWHGQSLTLVVAKLVGQPDTDAPSLLQLPPPVPANQEAEFLQINFEAASRALDRLDTHFTLPTYDVETALQGKAYWLPQCLPWLRAKWFAWDCPVEHISVYYDGSFLQQKGTAGAAAVAFVYHSGAWHFAGATSALIPEPEFGSYTAEIRAAMLATKQAYDLLKVSCDVFGCRPSLSFHFDSLSVGRQAEGLWQAKKDKTACHAIRSILRIMQSRWHVQAEHVFVPGHSGDPGNEAADTLALCAAQGYPLQDCNSLFEMLTHRSFVQALAWGWAFQHPTFGCSWGHSTLRFPAKPHTTPDPETVGPVQIDQITLNKDSAVVRLSCLTCNVLTLLGKEDVAAPQTTLGPARLQSIVRQVAHENVTIFALQETRLRTNVRLQHPDYHLWHSPANHKGQFGMMLGFAKKQPVAFNHDGTPHQKGWLEEQALSVVAADPRFLIIKVQSCFFRCIVVAAHAPHSGAEQEVIEAFWNSVAHAMPNKFDDWPKLLLADANCRFGDCPNQHIGDHDAETSTPKSEAFSHFVVSQNLFLPASFASCHSGPSGTWRHPNGEWTRNDVIGICASWPLLQCRSWVDTDIDVTLQKEDHRPARVLMEWHVEDRCAHPIRRHPKCPAQFCTQALSTLKQDWMSHEWMELDVHTHFHSLQHDLATCTRYPDQSFARAPKKRTMSEETWKLVCTKRNWRRNLAACQQLQHRTFLQAFLLTWKQASSRMTDRSALSCATEFDGIMKQLDVDIATALHQFRSFGRKVTHALRDDDANFYGSLAQESSQWLNPEQARQFWQVLRRNLPRFRQRRVGYDPLKIDALEDQWMPHFCQLEVGETTTPSQLLDECHSRQMQAAILQNTFDITDLPSIGQLEDVLRQTSAGKATGYDVLPSLLFRQHPCDLAELFFPLMFKMYVWQHEPIAGKGGQLAVIHKKGSPFVAQNYRGIMLLPTFTKRVHALLRTQIMDLLHRQRPPGQLGGFAHQQVMYGSQSLQVFGRIMDGQNITTGILFLDLTTAFHRLVREWISGIYVDQDLEAVLAAMEQEQLPIADMCTRLHLPCLLERLGAPAFLIQLIKDVHAHTWMTVAQNMATTKRGTRPGSPLADCVFHVLMSDILHHLQAWIDSQEAFNDILHEHDVPGSFVAWADDLAIPWATRCASDMPAELRRVLTFVLQLFQKYGFLLNLDKGKTSAVVSFRGPGAPLLRQRYQLGPRPGEEVHIADQIIFLHYVPSYKHLGTIFAANHRMDLEIRNRIGQAQAAFNQVAKPILSNRHLPESTRVQLFQALIGTKLFFGFGAWPTPTHRQMAKIKAVLLRMLQKVLRFSKEDMMKIPASEVFRRAKQPDPRVRLAVDRLMYAQRLWQHGPEALQHLLHREQALCTGSWMEGLLADLHWLQTMEHDIPSPIDLTDLTALFDLWQSGSVDWQKRVKSAFRRFQRQELMMQQMHRLDKHFLPFCRSAHHFKMISNVRIVRHVLSIRVFVAGPSLLHKGWRHTNARNIRWGPWRSTSLTGPRARHVSNISGAARDYTNIFPTSLEDHRSINASRTCRSEGSKCWMRLHRPRACRPKAFTARRRFKPWAPACSRKTVVAMTCCLLDGNLNRPKLTFMTFPARPMRICRKLHTGRSWMMSQWVGFRIFKMRDLTPL